MNIIHYNPHNDIVIAEYIDTLNMAMTDEVVSRKASTVKEIKKELTAQHADIINIHGCWHHSLPIVMSLANKHKARLVVTPHGQLEPWVMSRQDNVIKLFRQTIYQRKLIRQAYSVIVMGEMEYLNTKKIGWTERIEIVSNSLFTSKTTDTQMAKETLDVYQKVMDSNVFQAMEEQTRKALFLLFKAAVTNNRHWIDNEEVALVGNLDYYKWRQIIIYGYTTSTLEYILRGADVFSITPPECHPENIRCYCAARAKRIAESNGLPMLTLGDNGTHSTDDMTAMIRAIKEKAERKTIGISDIILLAVSLFNLRIDEDELRFKLDEAQLSSFAARAMALCTYFTCMPEGFLIMHSKNDRKTKSIINSILTQLKL